jgi:hypothetical protein
MGGDTMHSFLSIFYFSGCGVSFDYIFSSCARVLSWIYHKINFLGDSDFFSLLSLGF